MQITAPLPAILRSLSIARLGGNRLVLGAAAAQRRALCRDVRPRPVHAPHEWPCVQLGAAGRTIRSRDSRNTLYDTGDVACASDILWLSRRSSPESAV